MDDSDGEEEDHTGEEEDGSRAPHKTVHPGGLEDAVHTVRASSEENYTPNEGGDGRDYQDENDDGLLMLVRRMLHSANGLHNLHEAAEGTHHQRKGVCAGGLALVEFRTGPCLAKLRPGPADSPVWKEGQRVGSTPRLERGEDPGPALPELPPPNYLPPEIIG